MSVWIGLGILALLSSAATAAVARKSFKSRGRYHDENMGTSTPLFLGFYAVSGRLFTDTLYRQQKHSAATHRRS